jgi:hypothetical protein
VISVKVACQEAQILGEMNSLGFRHKGNIPGTDELKGKASSERQVVLRFLSLSYGRQKHSPTFGANLVSAS